MAGKGDIIRPYDAEKFTTNFDKIDFSSIRKQTDGKFKGNSDKPGDIQIHTSKEAWRNAENHNKP